MSVDVSALIRNLQKSALVAECPECGEEFRLSKSLLFDGRAEFPSKAEERREELLRQLKDRTKELAEQEQRATSGSEKATIAVGVGKIIEKILPAHRNFGLVPSDCRFIAEPIDMVVFDGITENKINRITFLDVKTGNAQLTKHQRQVRDAITDHDVKWRSY